MAKTIWLVLALTLGGCAPSISEQCTDLATAICAWAYRCPNSGYTYIDRGTSEQDCIARYGFSGAPAAGCENVTSESQACSSPETWHASEVPGCVDEINAAECSASGPLTGTRCNAVCQ